MNVITASRRVYKTGPPAPDSRQPLKEAQKAAIYSSKKERKTNKSGVKPWSSLRAQRDRKVSEL